MTLFPVAILAGGLGTRLGDLTRDKPKCLVDVNGKPFIVHQLELLKSQGIEKVVLCLGHQWWKVAEAINGAYGNDYSLKIDWSSEEEPLGTAGAIRKALPLLGDEFFVLYGDSYLECDYRAVQEAYRASGEPALMTVYRTPHAGNTEFNHGYVGGHNKSWKTSNYTDYGLGVFERDAIEAYGASDLSLVYQRLAFCRQLSGLEMPNRFREIGSLEGLEDLRSYLSQHESFRAMLDGGTKIYATHTPIYLEEVKQIVDQLDQRVIERMVARLANLRANRGRLFILGVGGSAANASHAVNDFRKICGIEAYAPTDNVAELTARTNDDGWETVFLEWLITSNASANDMILILSVGGGTMEASYCIAKALCVLADRPTVIGIVGRNTGYTSSVAAECLVIPEVNSDRVTPHAEEFQSVVLHLIVSHPRLQK